MEGIVTLIVIIVVFNLINALFRAIRGGQPASRKTAPVRPDPPFEIFRENPVEERVDNTAYYYAAFPDDVADPEPDYGKKSGERDETEEEITGKPATEERQTVAFKPESVCKPSTIASGLQRALTREDPLVSAFIFQEIFRQPPAMRRRR